MAVGKEMLVIVGPTASGKSELALRLARQTGAEILSLDSMQVYRGMDIGTAKPSAAEQAEVRHHLIDVVEANEPFTVARFVEMADAVIADARQRQTPLIATGGTPLYYKALFEGLFEGPGADEALRQQLREIGNEALHARLQEVDPDAAARIHLNDTKRLIRALEVYELTGRPISQQQQEWGKPMRHEAIWVGINWEKETLNRRINTRVKQMLDAGWVAETQALLTRRHQLSPTAAEATGYAELIDALSGRTTLEDAAEQIKIATRQLARRQIKWFRRFPHVTWLAGEAGMEQAVDKVRSLWPTQTPAR